MSVSTHNSTVCTSFSKLQENVLHSVEPSEIDLDSLHPPVIAEVFKHLSSYLHHAVKQNDRANDLKL